MAGGRRFIPPVSARLPDEASDRVRRNHDERITELQKVPITGGLLVRGVKLPDATDVPIHHDLGRRAVVIPSVLYAGDDTAVTTGGILRDRTPFTSSKYDGKKYAVIRASGWGTTMYGDFWIF